MEAHEVEAMLRTGFGAGATVRARRPHALFQINVPAYLADGDGVALYARPLPDGRLLLTDIGQTIARLSYTRKLTAELRAAVSELAERHGFGLEADRLVSTVRPEDLLAGSLGMIQIQSEAEVTIAASVARGEGSAGFRTTIREMLADAFRGRIEFDFHEPSDKDGLYALDARVDGPVPLGVAIASTSIEAERAVSTRFHLAEAPRHPNRWVAITKDSSALDKRTLQRLMTQYLVPVPKFEDNPQGLVPKLEELAA